MTYDFETVLDRRDLGSAKWKEMEGKNPNIEKGIVPLSVADMEFKHPAKLLDGIKEFLDRDFLGYGLPNRAYYEAVISFMEEEHNFPIEKDWIVNTPGVVPAIFNAIKTLTNIGDGVIIMPPVYHPFSFAIERQNRKLVSCPLINKEGHYEIDFDLFEKLARDPANKVLLFCSPHNPVGRVWTRKELARLGELIKVNDLFLLSDEIHFDLVMPGFSHTVFQTIDEELADRTITMTAPTKTFNLAGISVSNIIIKNKEIRDKFTKGLDDISLKATSSLAYKACEIAYNECRDWLRECIEVIDDNQRYIHNFFKERHPRIKANLIEGTYLAWIDFRALEMDYTELEDFMTKDAKIFLDEGYIFGKEGEGFERINLAAPRSVIIDAMDRLDRALDNLEK